MNKNFFTQSFYDLEEDLAFYAHKENHCSCYEVLQKSKQFVNKGLLVVKNFPVKYNKAHSQPKHV